MKTRSIVLLGIVMSVLFSMVLADMSSKVVSSGEYPASVKASKYLTVYWKIHYQTPGLLQGNDTIEFALVAKTKGWVALGLDFKDGIGMKQADCFMGYYDQQNDKPMVLDDWLPGKSIPKNDSIFGGFDDILSVTGQLSNGITTLKFTRKIDTGDHLADHPVRNATVAISWATNVWSPDVTQKHTFKGDFEINLVTHHGEYVPNNPEVLKFHYIAAAGVVGLFAVIGIVYSILASRNQNLILDLIFHRKFSKLISNRIAGYFLNPILDLTVGEVLLILTHLGLAGTWFAYGYLSVTSANIAKGFAYVIVISLTMSIIPVTRYSVLLYIFGVSFERAAKYHIFLTRMTILAATIHGILMTVDYAQGNMLLDLLSVDSGSFKLFGIIAYFSMIILATFSLDIVRRKLWELFKIIHMVFVPIVLIMVSLHAKGYTKTLPTLGISIGLLLIDHTIRIILGYIVPTKVVKLEYNEESEVTLCVFEKPSFAFFAPTETLGFGKFVYLYIPAVDLFQSHPFTISSYVRLSGIVEFTCHVKNLGRGWTKKLSQVANKHSFSNSNLLARVEGPYGKLSVNPSSYEAIVLIAGGIGITPINALYNELISKRSSSTNIYLCWTVRDESILKLFPSLSEKREETKQHFYVTRRESGSVNSIDSRYHYGERPNFTELLSNIGESVSSDKYAAVFACGPQSMLVDVHNAVQKSSNSHVRFHLHKEVFEL